MRVERTTVRSLSSGLTPSPSAATETNALAVEPSSDDFASDSNSQRNLDGTDDLVGPEFTFICPETEHLAVSLYLHDG